MSTELKRISTYIAEKVHEFLTRVLDKVNEIPKSIAKYTIEYIVCMKMYVVLVRLIQRYTNFVL